MTTSPALETRNGSGGLRGALTRQRRLISVLFVDGFRVAPRWMTAVMVTSLIASLSASAYPIGYRFVVNASIDHRVAGAIAGLVIIGVSSAVGWFLGAVSTSDAATLADRMATAQTGRLIKLIANVPYLEHLERPEYLAQVESLEANRMQLIGAPRRITMFVANLARVVMFVVILVLVSPWLLIMLLSAVAPIVATARCVKITKQIEDDAADTFREARAWFEMATEAESAMEIRCYGLRQHFVDTFTGLVERGNSVARRGAWKILGVQTVGWLIYSAVVLAMLTFTVHEALIGGLTVGAVALIVSLIMRGRREVSANTQSNADMLKIRVTADRMLWLEDHAEEIEQATGDRQAPAVLRDGIVVSELDFAYPGTSDLVLNGITMRLPAGAVVAIVGENGSGKSTLVKLLLGMYQPTAGHITVEGVDLLELDPHSWQHRCTATFQDFSRFELLATEVIGVGEVEQADDKRAASRALDRAGFSSITEELDDGLDTFVGTEFTGGQGLSGGQWQKLALARMLRRPDPLLAVMDEPAASLDPESEDRLFARYARDSPLRESRCRTITVLVTHRLSTVRAADLIVLMADGAIVEQGSHDDLMALDGEYARQYRLQSASYTTA